MGINKTIEKENLRRAVGLTFNFNTWHLLFPALFTSIAAHSVTPDTQEVVRTGLHPPRHLLACLILGRFLLQKDSAFRAQLSLVRFLLQYISSGCFLVPNLLFVRLCFAPVYLSYLDSSIVFPRCLIFVQRMQDFMLLHLAER